MKCYYHNNQEASVTCSVCGKALCRQCAEQFSPIMCIDCARESAANARNNIIKNLIISAILFVAGIILFIIFNGSFNSEAFATAYCFAGLPWGWQALNKITPDIFVFMPIVGWLIYFIIKALLAVMVGWVALPIKIIKSIGEMKNINKINQVENL